MHKSTEDEILSILSKNESMTIYELSISLSLTKADIRYHILKLLKTGAIYPIQPESGKPGRPAIRYKIDNTYFAHNLPSLIDAIFSFVPLDDNNISKISNFICSKIETSNTKSTIIKFNDLIIGLTKQNYIPRWETQYSGPVIYFSNCPYRQIIQKHPLLCEMDRKIIEEFLEKKVTIVHSIQLNETKSCKFQICV